MKMKDKYSKTENEPLIPWEIQYMLMNDKVWSTYKGNETKTYYEREEHEDKHYDKDRTNMKDKYNKTEHEALIPWEIQYILKNDRVW